MKRHLLLVLISFYSISGFSQLVEGFESATGITGPLPATWPLSSGNWAVFERNTPATIGTSQSWGINAFATGRQYQGTNCASVSRENIGMGNTSEDYLAMPMVHIPITQSRLRFFTRTFTAGNQGTIFRILVAPGITGLQTNPATYTPLVEWTETNLNTTFNVYEEKVVDLSAFAGIDVYIAFERIFQQPTVDFNGDRWIIDNVSVESVTGCNRPLNMHADYTSYTTLNFTWNSEASSSWEVLVLPCSSPYPTSTDAGTVVNTNSFIFTGLTPDTCYAAYIRTLCPSGGMSDWYDITPTLPVNGKFILHTFVNTNNNGIWDSGERSFEHGNFTSVMDNTGPTTYYASNDGHLDITLPVPLATYDFNYQIDSDYTPYFALGTFNFDDIPTPDINQTQILNFPIIQTQDYSDTGVFINSYTPPKAGNVDIDYLYLINYSHSNSSSGVVTYTKDTNTTIFSVDPATNVTLTPTGFTYTFSNLSPDNGIGLTINTNIPPIPIVNIGDVLHSNASLFISGADTFSANNLFNASQAVVASYDPNVISESHGNKIQFDQFSQNEYLYYTIHFQNTGNANTSTVRVQNILDSKIDESTLSMVNSSHNYMLQRTNNNLVWNFNNITLTPAVTNDSQSQGYVQYKVKLKPGFVIGDIILGTASIYFDSNPAIVTNTFNTEFVLALGNPTFNDNTISLYPNPTSELVSISNSNANDKIANLVIYEISGKQIYALTNNKLSSISVDVSNFARGLYLVELTSEDNIKITKKLLLE
ncbi:MAG: T9SS type A sorting domain-containing protein [Bacteroidota bacterium]